MAGPLKLNIGCGMFPLAGYVNLDKYAPGADVHADFLEVSYEGVEEIVMSHLLEHLSWRQTVPALEHLRSWLKPGGRIVVEVPDMEVILALGTGYGAWVTWIYGVQSDDGEYHRAGFTAASLAGALIEAGFGVEMTALRRFVSDHPMRQGFPCIEAVGIKPL